ncbi:MAG: CHRD domain-containing protein [Ilumatobacteraceae bacterium]
MTATRQQLLRRGAVAASAIGALALIGPTIASGSALDTFGANAAGVQATMPYTAVLSGANEVPGPGDGDGTGAAAITIDRTSGEICFDLRASDITTATAAHIHRGATGVAGAIEVTLVAPTPTSAGCTTATPTLAGEIADNPANFYVNVHSTDFPDGAIRGQLAAATTMSGSTQILAEPIRVYDSREGTVGPIMQGETRVVSLASGVNGAGQTVLAVPPGASAAMVRLTVTDSVGAGFLKLYSNALTVQPATSAANWYQTGSIVGADATVAVDPEGKVKVTAGVNQTHFVIDVVGYVF